MIDFAFSQLVWIPTGCRDTDSMMFISFFIRKSFGLDCQEFRYIIHVHTVLNFKFWSRWLSWEFSFGFWRKSRLCVLWKKRIFNKNIINKTESVIYQALYSVIYREAVMCMVLFFFRFVLIGNVAHRRFFSRNQRLKNNRRTLGLVNHRHP